MWLARFHICSGVWYSLAEVLAPGRFQGQTSRALFVLGLLLKSISVAEKQ